MKEWLSVEDMMALTGLPEVTLRYYLFTFADFFPGREIQGCREYRREGVGVIGEIAECYRQGYSPEEVLTHLEERFPRAPIRLEGAAAEKRRDQGLKGIKEGIAALLEEIDEEVPEVRSERKGERENHDRWIVGKMRHFLEERRLEWGKDAKKQNRK